MGSSVVEVRTVFQYQPAQPVAQGNNGAGFIQGDRERFEVRIGVRVVFQSLGTPAGIAGTIGAEQPGEIMGRMIEADGGKIDDASERVACVQQVFRPDVAENVVQGQGSMLPGSQSFDSAVAMRSKERQGLEMQGMR